MGATILAIYKSSENNIEISDNAENIRYTQIDEPSEVIESLAELEFMISVDSYILPEDFPQSTVADQLYEQLPPVEDGCYVAIAFLIHTDGEDNPDEAELEAITLDIEKALSAYDLRYAKNVIVAFYGFTIKK